MPFGGNDFGDDDDDGVICVVDISDADIEDNVAGDIDVVFDDFGDDGDDGDDYRSSHDGGSCEFEGVSRGVIGIAQQHQV